MSPVLPDLTIRQLEYLVAVADEDTWAAAAQRVGVSPSALSQGLAEFERRLGVPLFEAHGRRRVLRHAAHPVLDHARGVLAQTRDLIDWSDRVRWARHGRVRVGMIDVAAIVHFPHVLASFRSERPDVELTLSVAPSAALLDDLRDGELDVVVCTKPQIPRPGLDVVELLREPLAVMAPFGSVVGPPSRWGPWVTFPTSSHTRQLVQAALAKRGAPTVVAAESHQPDVLSQMVRLGLGWTVLPATPAVDSVVAGPTIAERVIVLARRSGWTTDPAADELARRLQTPQRTSRRRREQTTASSRSAAAEVGVLVEFDELAGRADAADDADDGVHRRSVRERRRDAVLLDEACREDLAAHLGVLVMPDALVQLGEPGRQLGDRASATTVLAERGGGLAALEDGGGIVALEGAEQLLRERRDVG